MKIIAQSKIPSIMRDCLVYVSQLDKQFVRNAASQYGTSMSKNVKKDVFEALDTSNSLIFFMIEKETTTNNMTMEADSAISMTQSYAVHVDVYGDSSMEVSSTVIARLLSQRIRHDLYLSGVHLDSIGQEGSIYELKNDVAWLRNTFIIHISCEHRFEHVVDEHEVESLTSLTIIRS